MTLTIMLLCGAALSADLLQPTPSVQINDLADARLGGDLDGDGGSDLVGWEGGGSRAVSATTGAEIAAWVGSQAAALGDSDGDGFGDVGVRNSAEGFRIYYGGPSFGLDSEGSSPLDIDGYLTELGDVTGDGLGDAAVGEWLVMSSSSREPEAVSAFVSCMEPPYSVGDLDEDGVGDVLCRMTGNQFQILLGSPDGAFTSYMVEYLDEDGYGAYGCGLDADADGLQDLAVAIPDTDESPDGYSGSIQFFMNHGSVHVDAGVLPAPEGLAPDSLFGFSVACGDFDDDGIDDLATYSSTGVLLYRGPLIDAVAPIQVLNGPLGPPAYQAGVDVGDVDNDGVLDLVANLGAVDGEAVTGWFAGIAADDGETPGSDDGSDQGVGGGCACSNAGKGPSLSIWASAMLVVVGLRRLRPPGR